MQKRDLRSPLNGTVEEVETITPAALTERYHALLREGRVELFFVGRCPAEMLLDRINAAFGAYPVGSPLAAPTQIVRRADQVREVTEVQKVAQGKLVLGFRSGFAVADPDYLNFYGVQRGLWRLAGVLSCLSTFGRS